MRKLLFLFVLMLTGCGLMATPTPTRTPRPTATPTEALEYYPTVEPEIQMLLTEYFEEYKKNSCVSGGERRKISNSLATYIHRKD